MIDSKNYNKNVENLKNNNKISDTGVYVKEDDQDWGSSGMNNIQSESN